MSIAVGEAGFAERAFEIAQRHIAAKEGLSVGEIVARFGAEAYTFPALGKRYLLIPLEGRRRPDRPEWEVLVDLTTGEVAADDFEALRRAERAAREAGVDVVRNSRGQPVVPPFDCPVTFVAGQPRSTYSVRPAESPDRTGSFKAPASVTVLAQRIGGGDWAEVFLGQFTPGEPSTQRSGKLTVRCGSTTTLSWVDQDAQRAAAGLPLGWVALGAAALSVGVLAVRRLRRRA